MEARQDATRVGHNNDPASFPWAYQSVHDCALFFHAPLPPLVIIRIHPMSAVQILLWAAPGYGFKRTCVRKDARRSSRSTPQPSMSDCDVTCCASAQVVGAQLALPGKSSSGLPSRLGAASGKGVQQCPHVTPSPRRLMSKPSHSMPLLHSFQPYGLPSTLELHLGLPRTPQTLVQDRTHSLWASRLCWRPLGMQVATCPLSTQVRVHSYILIAVKP